MLLSLSVSAQIYTKKLEKSALKGDEKSIIDLGICYLNGSGIGVDNEKAFDCFFKVLKDNNVASYYIAQMVEKGLVSESQVNLLMSDIERLEERFAEEAPNTMRGGSLDLAEKADAGYHTTFIIGFELG